MKNVISPYEMLILGQALDRVLAEGGPYDDTQRSLIAVRILRSAQSGIWDLAGLVRAGKGAWS